MTRRSPEVVDGALGFQHHGSPRDASYVWEALDILAEEVRALRRDLARADNSRENACSALNAASDEVRDLRATIARVEALLSSWYAENGTMPNRYRREWDDCAADLHTALKAKP